MIRVLIEVHFIPATPPLVGPTAKNLFGGLASAAPGSLQAAGPGHWAYPGNQVNRHLRVCAAGHKQCVGGKRGAGEPIQPTTLGSMFDPTFRSSKEGRGSYRPALSTLKPIRDLGAKPHFLQQRGTHCVPSELDRQRAVVPRHPWTVGLRKAPSPQCPSVGRIFITHAGPC